MSTRTYRSYEQAAADYLTAFDTLLRAPARAMGPRPAAAALASAETLVERADAIADISAQMTPLAQARLETARRATREKMSAELAAQAAAEFHLATELLDIVERAPQAGSASAMTRAATPTEGSQAAEQPEEEETLRENPDEVGSDEAGPTSEGPGVAIAVAEDSGPSMRLAGLAGPTAAEPSTTHPASEMHSVRRTALQEAVHSLHKAMEAPPARAMAPAPRAAAPADIASAKAALRQAAIAGAAAISDRACQLGSAVALDLITQTEWRAVVNGASMINKEIAAKLEALKKGAGALIERAVAAVTKTLLNVYDKLLALLGKDTEDQARQKVRGWLEQIRLEQKVDLLGNLMAQFYGLAGFPSKLDEWLGKTAADADKVGGAANAVQEVPARFSTLAGHLTTVEDAVVLAKRFVKLPQVLAIAAGIQVLLLSVIVYSGYDYIGYRELKFPNLARGVAQVVQEGLA